MLAEEYVTLQVLGIAPVHGSSDCVGFVAPEGSMCTRRGFASLSIEEECHRQEFTQIRR